MNRYTFFSLLFTGFAGPLMAQTPISRDEAISRTLQSNPQVLLQDLRIEKQRVLLPATFNLPNPELLLEAPTGRDLRPGILQSIAWPGVYTQQRRAQQSQLQLTEQEKSITQNNLRYQVRVLHNQLQYLYEVQRNLRQQDSLLADLVAVSEKRQHVGQISRIDRLNAESQYREVQYQLGQVGAQRRSTSIQLGLLIGQPNDTGLQAAEPFSQVPFSLGDLYTDTSFNGNPYTLFYRQNRVFNEQLLRLEQRRRIPGFVVGYLNQGDASTGIIPRLRMGLSLPIWSWTYKSRINGARKDVEIAKQQQVLSQYELTGVYDRAVSEFLQYTEALSYFQRTGLPQAQEIIRAAQDGYRLGAIGYYNYLLNLQQAFKIQQGYLEALKNYNQSVFTLQFIKGQ